MSNQSSFGRLQRVELRDAWATEAGDFTPWLAKAENLRLLSEAIGSELELEAQEKNVGPFRADILCRNALDDSFVLIENQLERTDHIHLGQLLTYAAGLDAVTIVWVAQKFTEEHRAALDWLNEKTPEGIGFFGLEVELWRIAESPVAPKFNVVSKPNEWTRTVIRSSRANPELAELCQDYWAGVLQKLEPAAFLAPGAKPVRKQDILYRVGWHDFWLKSYFSRVNGKLGIWLACRGPNAWENYLQLEACKDQIESAFGGPLVWEGDEDENKGSCSHTYREGDGFDPTDRDDWERQHRLLAHGLTALYRAVAPHVQRIEEENDESERERERGVE